MRRIKDFEDYSITSCGKVWSHKTNKWLKPRKDRDGYLEVLLYKDGKTYHKTIHRLVAFAFIPKTKEDIRLGRDQIDHIDGCRTNNNVNNLRWCTNKENSSFPLARENKSKANKIMWNNPGEREKRSKSQKIVQNRPEIKEKNSIANSKKPIIIDGIEYRSQAQAARELGILRATIFHRLNNPNFPNYKYKEALA